MDSTKISAVFKNNIIKSVVGATENYLTMPPEKRHELEEKGINLGAFIAQGTLPIILNSKFDSVLVAMEEGIGNMVMLTPALRLLRAQNPRLHITVLCKKISGDVIRNWDVVDKVIHEFDYGFYDLVFFTIWSGQQQKQLKEVLKEYSKAVYEVSMEQPYHESLHHMSICNFLDGQSKLVPTHCDIATGVEAEAVDLLLKDVNEFVVFGDTCLRNYGWDKKKWPHYVKLSNLITKNQNLDVVLIGDKDDYTEYDQEEWPNGVFNFAGKLSIPQLAYLLTKAKLYVGNDTGPTHIAASVGCETHAIFAPTILAKNKPLGNNVHIIKQYLGCSPCQYTDRWDTCDCMEKMSADFVYGRVFYPDKAKPKDRVLLVGTFDSKMLRNEPSIKRILEKELDTSYKVVPFDYRASLNNTQDPIKTTFDLINSAVENNVSRVVICGGQNLVPEIISHVYDLISNVEIYNWYVDNRGEAEPWFRSLCSVCTKSYWSTGDPKLLSQVFSKNQRMCEYLPDMIDSKIFHPLNGVEKDLDVLFVGTPHSEPRVELLKYLVNNGVKVEIYGDGEWPEELKPFAKPGVFGAEYNKLLNRSKIILNTNIINDVSLYFSNRYFIGMATKTVGLNQYIPQLEDYFVDGKHMVFFNSHEQCLAEIEELLEDESKREYIEKEAYNLYTDKYTMKYAVERIMEK